MALQYYELAAQIDRRMLPPMPASLWFVGAGANGLHTDERRRQGGRVGRRKALALDSSIAEVHYMVGVRRAWLDWNWDGAMRSLRKTIELKPNMVEAHAYFLICCSSSAVLMRRCSRLRRH